MRKRESFYDYQKVAELRRSRGLSKEDMARALGVTLMTVYRIEKGGCSVELLAKVAILLDIPLHKLIRSATQIAKNFSPAINM